MIETRFTKDQIGKYMIMAQNDSTYLEGEFNWLEELRIIKVSAEDSFMQWSEGEAKWYGPYATEPGDFATDPKLVVGTFDSITDVAAFMYSETRDFPEIWECIDVLIARMI